MPKKGDGNVRGSVRDLLRARPDQDRVNLAVLDPAETDGMKRRHAPGAAARDDEWIMELQNRLYAEGKRSVLIVLQGTDTSGKGRHRAARANQFEAALVKSGTTVVKLCLHISYEEQRKRLPRRLSDPRRNWKFSPNDIHEQRYWDEYQAAYDVAIGRCSPASAPWYIVPSDHKRYRNWAVSRILIETVHVNPTYPHPKLDVAALTKRLQEAA